MRIYKKHPFSMPNSVKVDAIMAECDKYFQAYRDLRYLKSVIEQDKFTSELYDFLNTDGSMTDLLPGLPRPITGISCEALSSEQLALIDAAIEFKAADIKKILASLWDAFKEWFLDWWNVNRQVKYDLASAAAKFEANPEAFGYDQDFRAMKMVTFPQADWEAMVKACEKLNKIIETVPEKAEDLRQWLTTKEIEINASLSEFGQSCTLVKHKDGTSRYNLIVGNPAHDAVEITMNAGRWVYSAMHLYAKRCHTLLLEDFACRRRFGKLENLFKTGDVETLSDIVFIKNMCERHAANVFVVADALFKIFKAMRRNAAATAPKA